MWSLQWKHKVLLYQCSLTVKTPKFKFNNNFHFRKVIKCSLMILAVSKTNTILFVSESKNSTADIILYIISMPVYVINVNKLCFYSSTNSYKDMVLYTWTANWHRKFPLPQTVVKWLWTAGSDKEIITDKKIIQNDKYEASLNYHMLHMSWLVPPLMQHLLVWNTYSHYDSFKFKKSTLHISNYKVFSTVIH